MPKPLRYEQTITISQPAAQIWPLVADYSFDLQWRRGLSDMTPTPAGPADLGTQVHEELRSMGTLFVSDSTVTSVGHYSYRFVGDGDSGRVEGGRKVTEVSAKQCTFTYDIELALSGPTSLLRPVLVPILRRKLRQDLERFAELAEATISGLKQARTSQQNGPDGATLLAPSS